jgi:hypothetical protein
MFTQVKSPFSRLKFFAQPSVNGPSETEDILCDPIGVFRFAAYSGFVVLNMSFPVNGIV